jgi:signal transduction histidine kinase
MNTHLLLIAEQDLSIATILDSTPLTYSVVASGQVGLEHQSLAILVDVQSDNAGLEHIQTLSSGRNTPPIPILAITPPELRGQAIQAGASELLAYPLERVELLTRLKSLFGVDFGDISQPTPPFFQLDDFLGSLDVLAHDFNNPLGIVIYSLELALEIMDEDEIEGAAELRPLISNVLVSTDRLKFMIADTLDYFRLKSDRFYLRTTPIPVKTILDAAIHQTQKVAQDNNIALIANYAADLPSPMGDADLLQRVIIAALDTSIKFSQAGSTVQVVATSDTDGITIAITDPGRAVADNYLPDKIFGLALNAQAKESGSRSSVGISLAFCHAAMEKLNGKASIQSNSDTGLTTLTFWLPLGKS